MSQEGSLEDPKDIELIQILKLIRDATLKIKQELKLIKESVKDSGNILTTMEGTNKELMRKALEMGIDIADLLKNDT